MNNNFLEKFISLVESLQPIIIINSYNLKLADDIVDNLSSDFVINEFHLGAGLIDFHTKKRLKNWNLKQFFEHFDSKESGNHILFLKDIDNSLQDETIQYYLKSIAFKNLYKDDYYITIIIVSYKPYIPKKLEELIQIVSIPLPNREEINQILEDFGNSFQLDIPIEQYEKLSQSLLGLNRAEIYKVLNISYQKDGTLFGDINEIHKEKNFQIVKQNQNLELIETSVTMGDIGGVQDVKNYFLRVSKIFKEYNRAKKFGVEIPKIVLLSGIKGCGKSLIVKAVSNMLHLPLVEMSFKKLKASKDNSKRELALQEALESAQLLKPSILWVTDVDEVDYLFHKFLKWANSGRMELFIIVTINENINNHLNSWDFDKSFYIDLPKEFEREEIFSINLRQRKQKLKNIDIAKLLQESNGLNGAEISYSIKLAVETSFIEERELQTEDILFQIKNIKENQNG